jgi:hypothetical protein
MLMMHKSPQPFDVEDGERSQTQRPRFVMSHQPVEVNNDVKKSVEPKACSDCSSVNEAMQRRDNWVPLDEFSGGSSISTSRPRFSWPLLV